MSVESIKKRDNRIVDFDSGKIEKAISKASEAAEVESIAVSELTDKVVERVKESYDGDVPTVEDVQDVVEEVLIEDGYDKIAKEYILYRRERQELREAKSALGIHDDMKLSFEALRVLDKYDVLNESEGGRETPKEMFERVAEALSDAKSDNNSSESEEEFKNKLLSLEIVPDINILRAAGSDEEQISKSFALPIEDDLTSLFDNLKETAVLSKEHKHGFGVSFSFSEIRSKGSDVRGGFTASGPVDFLRLYDDVLTHINSNSSHMAFLNVHHPDIVDFINAKQAYDLNVLETSIILTEKFMNAAENDETYELVDPHSEEKISEIRARSILEMIAATNWRTGYPTVVFRENMDNSETEETPVITPTGSHPMLSYEGCFNVDINLVEHFEDDEIDWEGLEETVRVSVKMLDNAVDVCDYENEKMEEVMKKSRRIGIGVIGWADLLIKKRIPYNSDRALELAKELTQFISEKAYDESEVLASERGSCEFDEEVRNSTRITIGPGGKTSAIAGCSQGIEPYHSISYMKKTASSETVEVIPLFEEISKDEGFYSEQLIEKITMRGSIRDVDEVPDEWKDVFVTSHDCSAEDHLKMQVAFQENVDNGVSKTINMPEDSTIQELESVYNKAYSMGCKSVHVYREHSNPHEIINIK